MESWFDMLFEQGRQQGLAEARAEARAESVLHVLSVRGIHVDDASRQRIMSCMDLPTLEQWFDQAVNATQLSDVFGGLT